MIDPDANSTIEAAVEAIERGYQPLPIPAGKKRPAGGGWTHMRHTTEDVRAKFEEYTSQGLTNMGIILGEPSGGLVDVDLDHPKALRFRDHMLPRTPMRSGRVGRPNSHYWYRVKAHLPSTQQFKLPDGSMIVELRSTGAQTVVPPSIWTNVDDPGDQQQVRWEGEPWGGPAGPAVIDGRVLSVQVATLALSALLLDAWPKRGSRHEAYLALAGGLLRYGEGVHPFWERNVSTVIRALATVTNDEDGPDAREAESVGSTIEKLRSGEGRVYGWPRLAEIIGKDHVEAAKRFARKIETLAGFVPDEPGEAPTEPLSTESEGKEDSHDPLADVPREDLHPLDRRETTWDVIELDDYLDGKITMPEPALLKRTDGQALIYPGRVNMLYGRSESAKSWVALEACVQEMMQGERVLYIDLEDGPEAIVDRLNRLGVGRDDIRSTFSYMRPEEPMAGMQYDAWGNERDSAQGRANRAILHRYLTDYDPNLVVVDGMTVLYGLHGLNTNDTTGTEHVTKWLKSLLRTGRPGRVEARTVLLIDHTGKGAPKGSMPIGSQHKMAMVQGTALQVHVIVQPAPGKLGHMELVVGKDRPGEVRRIATSGDVQVAADVYMDSREEGVTRMRIEPPDPTPHVDLDDDTSRALDMLEVLTPFIVGLFQGDLDLRLSISEIEEGLRENPKVREVPSRSTLNRVMHSLVVQAVLEPHGVNRWRRYGLVPPRD